MSLKLLLKQRRGISWIEDGGDGCTKGRQTVSASVYIQSFTVWCRIETVKNKAIPLLRQRIGGWCASLKVLRSFNWVVAVWKEVVVFQSNKVNLESSKSVDGFAWHDDRKENDKAGDMAKVLLSAKNTITCGVLKIPFPSQFTRL